MILLSFKEVKQKNIVENKVYLTILFSKLVLSEG